MKYQTREAFEKVNMFKTGMENTMFEKYFIGKSYLSMFAKPGEWPVFIANVTFEPGCRNNWHIHHAKSGGGQMLICTAGEGWFQQEGQAAEELKEGSFVYIPSGVKHWHGAKKDSWFAHLSLELPGVESKAEWLEPVSDTYYNQLKDSNKPQKFVKKDAEYKFKSKKEFDQSNMFKSGMYNIFLRKQFTKKSYLKMITRPGKTPLFLANVTFEPGCVNSFHTHKSSKGSGQILICTAGEGWYQEEGKEAIALKEGSIVNIPANVSHWHGAAKDNWFSHITIELPGEDKKNEWSSFISEEDYQKLGS